MCVCYYRRPRDLYVCMNSRGDAVYDHSLFSTPLPPSLRYSLIIYWELTSLTFSLYSPSLLPFYSLVILYPSSRSVKYTALYTLYTIFTLFSIPLFLVVLDYNLLYPPSLSLSALGISFSLRPHFFPPPTLFPCTTEVESVVVYIQYHIYRDSNYIKCIIFNNTNTMCHAWKVITYLTVIKYTTKVFH